MNAGHNRGALRYFSSRPTIEGKVFASRAAVLNYIRAIECSEKVRSEHTVGATITMKVAEYDRPNGFCTAIGDTITQVAQVRDGKIVSLAYPPINGGRGP